MHTLDAMLSAILSAMLSTILSAILSASLSWQLYDENMYDGEEKPKTSLCNMTYRSFLSR